MSRLAAVYHRIPKWLRWLLALLLIASLSVGYWVWRMVRVEDIPAVLDPMTEDPSGIALDPVNDDPFHVIGDQEGMTTFYVIVGPRTDDREGVALNRALNRWVYPDTVQGVIVGDVEGAELFRDMAKDFIEFFRKESRFPIFADFKGAMMRIYKLPKGHHGFVVMGPDGEVLRRKSGGMRGEELDELRELLGASEPPTPPPAPDFDVGGLDKDACAQRACGIVFLSRDVSLSEIPGIDGGFDGEREEAFERMNRPEIRMAATVLRTKLRGAPGVVVGRIEGEDVDEILTGNGWTMVDDDPQARAAFSMADGESGMVVVDEQGRLAFTMQGFIPMYQWGAVADLLEADIFEEDD